MRYLPACLSLIAILLCGACRQESQETALSNKSIPESVIRYLLDSCSGIDYILYDPSLSMSIDKKADIAQHIDFISRAAGTLLPHCDPAGHILYQVGDRIPLEGDLFFGDSCSYLVLYDRYRRTYINRISLSGIEFFRKIHPHK